MEGKKQKNEHGHKNAIILPKSYIGQKPVKIKHRRYNSLNNSSFDIKPEASIQEPEINNFRFNTDRRTKKVSFNEKIQIIDVDNYKKENKILCYGVEVDEEEEKEEEINKRENKCALSIII